MTVSKYRCKQVTATSWSGTPRSTAHEEDIQLPESLSAVKHVLGIVRTAQVLSLHWELQGHPAGSWTGVTSRRNPAFEHRVIWKLVHARRIYCQSIYLSYAFGSLDPCEIWTDKLGLLGESNRWRHLVPFRMVLISLWGSSETSSKIWDTTAIVIGIAPGSYWHLAVWHLSPSALLKRVQYQPNFNEGSYMWYLVWWRTHCKHRQLACCPFVFAYSLSFCKFLHIFLPDPIQAPYGNTHWAGNT